MATHNYSISFKSLRSNTSYPYVLEISGGSGAFIPLKGGAQPFTTQEDDDEDQFAPIRTQSGTIRIVDDGFAADGETPFDWKDLAPVNDTERPVTLKANGVVYWQGFMQAQNFGGTLYGNPQEREFPVQCCLSVLAAQQVSTSQTQVCNFAYLFRYIVNSIPVHSFNSFVIQGGSHAQQWLLKRFDWNNFLQDNGDNDVEPRYNLYEVLEDMCRFWGWTIRTWRKAVYLTCADDTGETTFLTLNTTQLDTMAAGTAAGTVNETYISKTVSGEVYASTDNDDYKQRGPGKATVKADVNEQDVIVKFAPASVQKQMETGGWNWVQGNGDLIGFFEGANRLTSFTSDVLSGTADTTPIRGTNDTHGAFVRRQIYSTTETDKPTVCDMFMINNNYPANKNNPAVSIHTNKAMALKGGSLVLKGSVYFSTYLVDWDMNKTTPNLRMSLGIGPNINGSNAQYFNIYYNPSEQKIVHGWSTTKNTFPVKVNSGSIVGPMIFAFPPLIPISIAFPAIPVDGTGDMFGFIFIEFYRFCDWEEDTGEFQIGNFEIEFSRDSVEIPTTIGNTPRAREIRQERVTTQEYIATNSNQTHEEWNADCIFASDNNMEYGYGLLSNPNGSYMTTAPYAAGDQHPEQHLANRVANYWRVSRRRLGVDFRADASAAGTFFSNINPQHMLTFNENGNVTKMHPVAISRDWRNDIIRMSMLEMP